LFLKNKLRLKCKKNKKYIKNKKEIVVIALIPKALAVPMYSG